MVLRRTETTVHPPALVLFITLAQVIHNGVFLEALSRSKHVLWKFICQSPMSLYYQLLNVAYQFQLPSITNRPLVDELQNIAFFVIWRYECSVGFHVDDGFWRDVQVLRHFTPCILGQLVAGLAPYPGQSTYSIHVVWSVSHRDQTQHALLIVIVAALNSFDDKVMALWSQWCRFRWTGLFAP